MPATWLGIIIFMVSALYLSRPANAQLETRSGDLLQLSEDIKAEMPGKSSEGFAKPTATEMEKWQDMVTALLQSELVKADSLRAVHFPFYDLFFFADTSLENRNYTVLQENPPVQRGWGTVMVNPKL